MTKEEQTTSLISKYMDLLRIKSARNMEIEVENQLCEARAQLQALGVAVDELVIRQE